MGESEMIYGVNLQGTVTPHMVRDAIIQCFFEADSEVLDGLFNQQEFSTETEEKEVKYNHVRVFIKNLFHKTQGDFNNPTKESLTNVIDQCKQYAMMFRHKEIIQENYNKIMTLINKLE